ADDGQPCCEWMGPGGAGHFVKMVHNGIEYADMQMICEAFWLMQQLLGMSPADMSRVFAEWNRGELGSYLIGITAEILARTDAETGQPLVDLILDTAEQKGTGKWASQAALDLGVNAPTIADAVFARTLSAAKTERVAAAAVVSAPAFARRSGAPCWRRRSARTPRASSCCGRPTANIRGSSLSGPSPRSGAPAASFARGCWRTSAVRMHAIPNWPTCWSMFTSRR